MLHGPRGFCLLGAESWWGARRPLFPTTIERLSVYFGLMVSGGLLKQGGVLEGPLRR